MQKQRRWSQLQSPSCQPPGPGQQHLTCSLSRTPQQPGPRKQATAAAASSGSPLIRISAEHLQRAPVKVNSCCLLISAASHLPGSAPLSYSLPCHPCKHCCSSCAYASRHHYPHPQTKHPHCPHPSPAFPCPWQCPPRATPTPCQLCASAARRKQAAAAAGASSAARFWRPAAQSFKHSRQQAAAAAAAVAQALP